MADLFRRSVLDKLSSPEQLDKAIVITSPSFGIALLGSVVIVIAALIWGIFGRLPVKVEANGIYLSGEGTGGVYSEVTGIVTEVKVTGGDSVEEGDVVAYVGSGDVAENVKLLGERISAVEKVTLESTDDVATADNKALIDIKREVTSLQATYKQNQDTLEIKQSRLQEEKKKTEELKEKADQAKNQYYDDMKADSGSAEQLNYSESQAFYSSAKQYYESAYATYQKAVLEVQTAEDTYERTREKYEQIKQQEEQTKAAYEAAQEAYNSQNRVLEELVNQGASEEELEMAQGEVERLAVKLSEASNASAQAQQTLASAEQSLQSAEVSLTAANSSENMAYENVKHYENEMYQAEKNFEDAKAAYLASGDNKSQNSRNQSISGNEYSQANAEYSAQRSVYESLKAEIEELNIQLKQGKKELNLKQEEIRKSFNSTKESVLNSLKVEFDQNTAQLKKYEILSTQTGTVQEVVATEGMMVGTGSEIVKVKHGDESEKEAVCYIPVSSGKKVKTGMQVMIYPSTFSKQEYGHMSGTVERVASYVTSSAEMMKRLGDDTLAQSFMKSGPVIEVICSIKEDPDTASGYYWSSKKGAEVTLVEGTILSADIVTEKKAPITMVIPYLKEKLTVTTDASTAANSVSVQQ